MNEKIIKPVEEFANLASSEITELIRVNKEYYIVGNTSGKDRMIIEKFK